MSKGSDWATSREDASSGRRRSTQRGDPNPVLRLKVSGQRDVLEGASVYERLPLGDLQVGAPINEGPVVGRCVIGTFGRP